MRQNIAFALISLVLSAAPVLAQNLTASGCVAPSDFQSCQIQVLADAQACITACDGYDICVIACGCTAYELQIGCLIESCWNKAYTCEYQNFAVSFAAYCLASTSGVPFWPAPAGATESCSCNLENLYDSVMGSEAEGTSCLSNVTDQLLISNPSQAAKNDTGCQCCAASGAVSSFYDICPDTDPSLIGLTTVMNYISGLTNKQGFSYCDSTLSSFNCESDLGFSALGDNGEYYANSDLPASGTETLYNANGVLTSPPFGSATTISFSATSYVLTASPYNAANVASGGGAIATTGSEATGTSTQNAGTIISTKAAGVGSGPSASWFSVFLACGVFFTLVTA